MMMKNICNIANLGAALALSACSTSLPDGPGLEDVKVFNGRPAKPRPLPPKDVPAHPTLAAQSVFHDDHYNSDVTDFPAPLGLNPRVVSKAYGVCGTPRVDAKGRVITTCANPAFAGDPTAPVSLLYALDPDTLDVLAATPFFLGQFDGSNIGGGNYPHLLADGSVVNGGADGTLDRYTLVEDPASGGLTWTFDTPLDVSHNIPAGDAIFDMAPDFSNDYWFVTVGGSGVGGVTVGLQTNVAGDDVVQTLLLPGEKTENGLAIGEHGIYLVTDTALYRFDRDPETGAPKQSWREPYTSVPKPEIAGLFSEGSGSTPTLLGRRYIVITDNDSPQVNLLVYRRTFDGAFDGPLEATSSDKRLICKVPLFSPDVSANDLSVIGNQRSLVVTNWFGAPQPYTLAPGRTVPPFFSGYRTMAGGMTRVDIRKDESGCDIVWHNPDVRTNAVPKLSTHTGLIYYHGQDTSELDTDAYYMKAVSMKTGKPVFDVLAGTGPYFSGGGLTTTIGPNGAFYQATGGGIYKIQDEATGWLYALRYKLMRVSKLYRKLWTIKSRNYRLADIKGDNLPQTDCTLDTLLPSFLSLSQGGAPLCNISGQ